VKFFGCASAFILCCLPTLNHDTCVCVCATQWYLLVCAAAQASVTTATSLLSTQEIPFKNPHKFVKGEHFSRLTRPSFHFVLGSLLLKLEQTFSDLFFKSLQQFLNTPIEISLLDEDVCCCCSTNTFYPWLREQTGLLL